MLGRRPLVRGEVGVHRLEHQPLRSGHGPQPLQVVSVEHAEVGVRQQASFERALADPDDVRGEVVVAELSQLRGDPRVVFRALAGQDQQLLDAVLGDRVVEQP